MAKKSTQPLQSLEGKPILQPFRRLLYSRKALVATILALAALIIVWQMGGTPEQVLDVLKWAGSILGIGIAVEDGLKALGGGSAE